MKALKILSGIILLSITASTYGQVIRSKQRVMDSSQWLIASISKEKTGNEEVFLTSLINKELANLVDEAPTYTVAPSNLRPVEIELPEVVIEPPLYVEEWMITPFYYYLSAHGNGFTGSLGGNIFKKAD